MHDHHERAIQNLAKAYEPNQDVLAVVVGGSVAKGWATPGSDVDFMAVMEADAFARCLAEDGLMVHRTDLTDYEGGYAEGKFVDLPFLRMVAERGSEPARSAFLGAIVLFDRTGEVHRLVERILVYPEAGVAERIRRFHSQLMIWHWYIREAARRDDATLMSRAVAEFSLFAMRLILAHNRRLYPYHKWALRAVEECPDKPEGIAQALTRLNRQPSPEEASAVSDQLHAWLPLEVDYRQHCRHFLEDSEWNWIMHPAPIGDW